MIRVVGPRDKDSQGAILTVSTSKTWSRGLSPFFLGPVECYDGLIAQNVENAWQFAKVYPIHAPTGTPTEAYFQWRDRGWADLRAHRYPAGKGARPLYSLWAGNQLTYIEARKAVYIPLYAKAVVKSDAFQKLTEIYNESKDITLWDYDGYDHAKLGRTFYQVIHDPNRKCGHAFVLAMLLLGVVTPEGEYVAERDTQ